MLLEFKFKNFKTFQKETLFSMTPANKIKDIEYSVLKTNIISALEVFKSIILKGNIKNGNYAFTSPNEAVKKLELIPNLSLDKPQPVEFEIKFITGGIVYQYGIQIDLGTFLDSNYNRKILSETLLRVKEYAR